MHTPIQAVRGLAVGTAVAILVAACAAAATSGGAAAGMTIALAAPANGAQVSIPFDVQIDSNVPLTEPQTGNHHAHLYFDTSTDAPDYDIVYGNRWRVTRQLAPGSHQLTVALANPDHTLAGPTQTITVMVTAAGSGGAPAGSTPPAPSTAPGPLY